MGCSSSFIPSSSKYNLQYFLNNYILKLIYFHHLSNKKIEFALNVSLHMIIEKNLDNEKTLLLTTLHNIFWCSFKVLMYPCAKGFLILEFDSSEDKEIVLENGPWIFQGDFLCMEPWFPNFDLCIEIFTSTFLWVRLLCLPIQLWELDCLRVIGNNLKKYYCSSKETINYQNSAWARICIEMDLSNDLPTKILLKVGNLSRSQLID